jgi:acrylyl-CoA reductase (NADPH)
MSRALQVTRDDDGTVAVALRDDLTDADLAEGDVTIDVEYSGINYKDGLALAGSPGVMRVSPLIPGIDLVGTVSASSSPLWKAGDAVILNGWGIGETRDGGLTTRARVNGEWLVGLPAGISPSRAAAIGTAGFTAALSVIALGPALAHGSDDEVLVTGASGGVGSLAIALLARAGHRVIASTGSPEHRDYLLSLGAADTIDRATMSGAGRPLQKSRWAGVIDSVGGHTLANAIAQTNYGGRVAACGLVGGSDLPTTVMPFILRGVSLIGINSVECPMDARVAAWQLLERDLDLDLLDSLTTSIGLSDAEDAGAAILRGELRGRTVVDVRA